jgi:Ala-tRNA(Pro) deacylase
MHTPDSLHAELTKLGIAFITHHHAAVFTVADGAGVIDHLPGAHIKNLFVKDKKGGLYLITVLEDRKVDLVALGKHLGSKDRLSFANEETLMQVLGVKPGSVTPLALINAKPGSLKVVLDTGIFAQPTALPHPLTNTQTTQMRSSDLLAVIKHWGHTPQMVDVGQFIRT